MRRRMKKENVFTMTLMMVMVIVTALALHRVWRIGEAYQKAYTAIESTEDI